MSATSEEIKKANKKTTPKEKKAPVKPEKNTMDIKLKDSKNTTIKISGFCTDKEIKAVCRALNHSADQKFEVK